MGGNGVEIVATAKGKGGKLIFVALRGLRASLRQSGRSLFSAFASGAAHARPAFQGALVAGGPIRIVG
jgi:hypothetical protein